MSDLGFFALRLAFVVALVGIGTGIYAGISRRTEWTEVTRRALLLTSACVGVAMLSLWAAFASFDFQLRYVAEHSARSMTLPYRLAALWGGQAGSLLLWLFMLCGYSTACAFANRRSNPRLLPWVFASLLGNAIFFLVLTNFVTNPFEKLAPGDVLSDGNGLNPLLQHPVMLIHPLMLYMGFVGFAVPFSFGLAALVTGDLGTAWLRSTRRWTLVPWFFLSIGILLGGRWAYEVLGWGGYWAWDPVENASFMPWLAATAYLHSVMIQEKRDMLKIWNLVLVGLTYSLCLFGTFLTRSGVVQSVHSFTSAGWFGYIFLGLRRAGRRRVLRSSPDAALGPAQHEPPRVGGVARGELPAQQLGVSRHPRRRDLGHALPRDLRGLHRNEDHRRSGLLQHHGGPAGALPALPHRRRPADRLAQGFSRQRPATVPVADGRAVSRRPRRCSSPSAVAPRSSPW